MAHSSPALLAESNLLRAAACWARASQGGRSWRSAGLFCTSSPVSMRSFNQLIGTVPVRAPELVEALAWYRRNGRRFRVRVRAEIEGSMRAAAKAAGLVRVGGMACMALQGSLPPRASAGLEIERVRDAATLAHHVSVVAEAFGWSAGDLRRVFRPGILNDPAWQAWVGYAGGGPVATAQLVAHEGVAGLYYIGVREGERGKGYGEAITDHAVREGRALGCELIALQASPAGYRLYRRLGFEEIGEYVTYVPGDRTVGPGDR